MAERFAFESGEVSIAFNPTPALGDTLIAKCVFDALVKLVPTCKIDVYFTSERNRNYIKAFYGHSQNLNATVSFEHYATNAKKYDAAFRVSHAIIVDFVNPERLQKKSAMNLLQSLYEIGVYSNRYLRTNDIGIILGNIARAHILGTNRYTCLSCDGALPIYDNHVKIFLSAEDKPRFNQLRLGKNYITIGSNLGRNNALNRHSLKEWPTPHALEYIGLLNRHMPQIKVVQIGGGVLSDFQMPTAT